ncbi:hypothetical protein [Pseudomonas chlororaphis]|uniref:hypothetical protein n=1 Tax=Pseudomonas chlororaphis TaxID=587753 RepID=UPI000864E68B|nr:hypothetical protein [Pseudomonas chlororaphis]AZD47548.1 hypothetical protein C4K20_2133 [Pseudomonas chlororaphis subsp. aurantiaca]BAV74225.1 hypothetical protein PCAU_2016 [Pseudomonas chlororaphis subsp. aurantiaca]
MRLPITNIANLCTNCTAVSSYNGDDDNTNLETVISIKLDEHIVWPVTLTKKHTTEILKNNKSSGSFKLFEGATLDLEQSDDSLTYFIKFSGKITEEGTTKADFKAQTIATFAVK